MAGIPELQWKGGTDTSTTEPVLTCVCPSVPQIQHLTDDEEVLLPDCALLDLALDPGSGLVLIVVQVHAV